MADGIMGLDQVNKADILHTVIDMIILKIGELGYVHMDQQSNNWLQFSQGTQEALVDGV